MGVNEVAMAADRHRVRAKGAVSRVLRKAGPGTVALGIVMLCPRVIVGQGTVGATRVDRLLNPQQVVLHIVHMDDVPQLKPEYVVDGQTVSFASLFAPGGLQIEIEVEEEGLPFEDASDPKALVERARTLMPPTTDETWHVSLLVVNADRSADSSLGTMPDTEGRAVAVVYAHPHRTLSGDQELQMFLSAAHALTHTFNLHHTDWEGSAFATDSTIEGYSMLDTVRWGLSAASIEHLRHHPDAYVRPGGVPFGTLLPAHDAHHQETPAESYRVEGAPLPENPEAQPAGVITHERSLTPVILAMWRDASGTTTRAAADVSLKVRAHGVPLAEIVVTVRSGTRDKVVRHVRSPAGTELTMKVDEVPLWIGENEVVVFVSDAEGRSATETLRLVREDVAGKLLAVVFGVQDYPRVARLKYALNDARKMREHLEAKLGVSSDRIFYEENPDVTTMRRGLGTWLQHRAGPKDVVIIYFSGHGASEPDEYSGEEDGLAKYLLPVNADLADLYATAFPMNELQTVMQRVSSSRIIILLDSCFSGSAGGRTVAAAGGRSTARLDDEFLTSQSGEGRVFLSASRPNEVAKESQDLQHGVYTYYLLEGLAGGADENGDHEVLLTELFGWVRTRVREATGNEQTPTLSGELQEPLSLWRAQE